MLSKLTFDELRLECFSRAGDSTWLRVRPPGVAFDVGRGSTRLAGVKSVFLTHGHVDHCLGLPFLLSMRTGGSEQPPLEIYCPAPIEEPLRAFIEAAGALDERRFEYRLHGLEPRDRIEVGKDLWVEAFPTDHPVPTLGYHLVRGRHRLRRGLEEVPSNEIARLRRGGETVDESYEELWLSCSGDTSAGVFEMAPEIFSSRVLMLECTFLDRDHIERSSRFGHMHLDDLVGVRERFDNEALVLYHLSRRHRPEDLRRAVRQRLEPVTPEVHVVG